MPDTTQIPAPRVPLIDERTGLISREWFRFFSTLFTITGSGSGTIPPDVLPPLESGTIHPGWPSDGEDGEQGIPGPRGVTGATGPQGYAIRGEDGEDGETGLTMVLNALSYQDATTYNAASRLYLFYNAGGF